MNPITAEYLRENFPFSFEVMLAISGENEESIDFEKEIEEFSDEMLQELEDIFDPISDITIDEFEEKFNIKFDDHQKHKINTDYCTSLIASFSKDEHMEKLCEKYPIIQDLIEILEDISFVD